MNVTLRDGHAACVCARLGESASARFATGFMDQGFAGSTWVLRSSGAASGEIMNWIMAREASGSLDTLSNATLDGQGSLRNPGSGPTYSVPGAPTMMLVCWMPI